jgi:hypothetical protein
VRPRPRSHAEGGPGSHWPSWLVALPPLHHGGRPSFLPCTRGAWRAAGALVHIHTESSETKLTHHKLVSSTPASPNQSHTPSHPQAFNKIQVPSHMHQMGYRDKAWSVNRLGTVAAK